MSRAQRLLDLIQLLRSHRRSVGAAVLAEALGVSVRTVYRDVETLRSHGARIDGAAGVGYLLRPGFMLPPLMFSEEEIEALVLGSRWIAERADPALAAAARSALAKIGAVLPAELRPTLDGASLLVGPGGDAPVGDADLAAIRRAIRAERRLAIDYRGPDGAVTTRRIWPIALAFFERVRVVVAWCELRQAFRHFRCDRIAALAVGDEPFGRRRQALLREWRAEQGIADRA